VIGQRDIDDEVRLEPLQQLHQLRHLVGIDLCRLDLAREARGDRIALGLRPAGQQDLRKDLGHLRAFVGDHAANPA